MTFYNKQGGSETITSLKKTTTYLLDSVVDIFIRCCHIFNDCDDFVTNSVLSQMVKRFRN